jgi:hypothetical protein
MSLFPLISASSGPSAALGAKNSRPYLHSKGHGPHHTKNNQSEAAATGIKRIGSESP